MRNGEGGEGQEEKKNLLPFLRGGGVLGGSKLGGGLRAGDIEVTTAPPSSRRP